MNRHAPRAAIAVTALALLASGCASTPVLSPTGAQGGLIENLWWLIAWICGLVYVAVLVGLGVALARRRGQPREGTTRDRGLHVALVAWGVLIIGLLTWMVAASFLTDRRIRQGEPDLELRVTAKQWWWEIEYVDGEPARHVTTANELVLPRDRTARLHLVSSDVIHSFWVPSLSGKHDLIPGTTNAILLTPRANGLFRGQCAEFCGLQHAHMGLDVRVVDSAAFEAWRARQLQPARPPAGAEARRGAALFHGGTCATCHRVQGTPAGSRMGPDLTHFASRRTLAAGTLPMTRTDVARWLDDPQHVKPGNHMPKVPLTPAQRADLVAYLMELR